MKTKVSEAAGNDTLLTRNFKATSSDFRAVSSEQSLEPEGPLHVRADLCPL